MNNHNTLQDEKSRIEKIKEVLSTRRVSSVHYFGRSFKTLIEFEEYLKLTFKA